MKKIKLYASAVLMLLCSTLFAQEIQNTDVKQSYNLTNLGKIELGLHGLNIGYEAVVARRWTVELAAGVGGGYMLSTEKTHYNFALLQPTVFLKGGARWNYNIDKRAAQGKNVINNSANYVGVQLKYAFERGSYIEYSPALLSEVHWGLQRPLGKKFIFNAHAGLGYINDFRWNLSRVIPTAGAKFGYVIF